MSTTAVAVPTSTDRFDIAYGFKTITEKDGNPKKDDKGNVVKEAVVMSTDEAEKLSDKNLFEGSAITVSVNYPADLDSFLTLATTPVNDDEGKPRDQKEVQAELIKLFVNGAKAKVMNRLRALLTKTDDKGNLEFDESKSIVNGVLDLTSEITSGSKRVFLTEEQKTWRSLSNLPAAVREQMWKVYLTSIGKDFYIPAE